MTGTSGLSAQQFESAYIGVIATNWCEYDAIVFGVDCEIDVVEITVNSGHGAISFGDHIEFVYR